MSIKEEAEAKAPDWTTTITTVERGFEAWAGKLHNAKWARWFDGTPIKNDLCVCIAEEIINRTLSSRQDDSHV